MSYSLNSVKGSYKGDSIRDYYRVTKGDTRSSDYSSYGGCTVLIRGWGSDLIQTHPDMDYRTLNPILE